ncbi:MAG: cyclic beta-1,2-glucan synthetase [bacterium P3]|nr:MAG: cyclic beta-1,2-glucan synthetase [bacterium P3]KWW38678.1 MAG: cyclic beta-1,2-glucan synthetase [bacterium F083]
MKSVYSRFRKSVKDVTEYYLLLVDETRRERLVGSTNEWVLDNYYMISEQEKVLRIELQSRGFRRIPQQRLGVIEQMLQEYLLTCHHQIDKGLMFEHLSHWQSLKHDYLSYPEVCALLPLVKFILIRELAGLCRQLKAEGACHYKPTDRALSDAKHLDHVSQQNLTMMNLFNSLKKMTRLPMAELIDAVSFSEQMLKDERAGMYDQMCDKTKEDYRDRIVRLSRKRKMNEYDLVKELTARADADGVHVGWQLFPPKRWEARARWYVWIVSLATLALSYLLATVASSGSILRFSALDIILTLLMAVPVSQLVTELFNQLLFRVHRPRSTFRLRFRDGLIPKEYATMVIMPTILKSAEKTVALLGQLEVYYLSNINRGNGRDGFSGATGQNLYYTLVGDAAAYEEADAPWDAEVMEAGLAKVRELNAKYGAPIFNFVYRRRAWSEGEGCWLGHERKRGAILHFNDLLLGHTSGEELQRRFRCETISEWLSKLTPEYGPAGTLSSVQSSPVQFVITLDTDTQLVLYSAQKLVGAMAHPLNRARLSADGRRVEAGYGIMQPRVNVDVEVTNKSRYAQLFAGLGGLDVYTTASFELYQDIFNEGTFCGKGIYDLRIFQHVLKNAFPENLILSHDLIEGCHIRCGLINDVELFDDNPSNYLDDLKRHHRWTRGDWQIVGWLRRRVRNGRGERVRNPVNTIGRWKIFDNLRRSVLSLSLVLMIIAGYTLSAVAVQTFVSPSWYVVLALAVVAAPILFFIWGQLARRPGFSRRYKYYMTLMHGLAVVVYRSAVQFALLPKEAWTYTDALLRSCYRMLFSHKNLLNWVPSDEAAKSTKGTLGSYVGKFWTNYLCAAVVVALMVMMGDAAALDIAAGVFCVLMWCGAPFLMHWLGRRFPQERRTLNPRETDNVRHLARDTWHFFDTLLVEENNYLIPDNYQLNRGNKTDYKTSPTNIGYSLTAVVSAAELGFIGRRDAVARLGHTVDTVMRLEKWHGHLFNWYDIHTLKALPNFFISTCDSGNFVACLYVVKGFLTDASAASDQAGALLAKVTRLIDQTDFSQLYNPELDVFSIGYDFGARTLLPYHYNNFASEARLTSFLAIAQGDAPYKHWFCLDKTLVQYRGYKGVASWYGTMFEYFMPLIFLPTYRHTLMDETYSFAIRAQRAFIRNVLKQSVRQPAGHPLPWGVSEAAYNELDDAQNYKYHAFGVPYLKFQNTTPDRIVLSPYSSLMAIGVDDRAVYDNMRRFCALGMYGGVEESPASGQEGLSPSFGFYESYDEEDHVAVRVHYAHHQGMILASITNYLADNCLQHYFMQEPVMRSMDTLLKEKAQVKPYIDLKVTRYKRYRYSKVQTESDARDYDGVANVPEVGAVSNGQYTVMLNDRGSGFSRFRNILLNRYREISSDHYGLFLYVRNLHSDRLWSATYDPLDVMPERYHVSFAGDKISFLRVDDGIETKTEVTVLKDRSAELRRYTFTNSGTRDVDLEITTYGEVVLAPSAEDENHRVFNGMKIQSEYDSRYESLIFSRSGDHNNRHYMLHRLWVERRPDGSGRPDWSDLVEYETSRLKFLGRGNSLRHADIIENRRTLTGTVGTTLDPVMSMRRRLRVEAGKSAEAYVLTGFAKAKEHLLQLAGQYRTPVDVEHAFKTASVFNNMRTGMSLLKGSQMRLYNDMAKYMGQTATLGNHRSAWLAANTLSQSGLWRFGISGDLAILLVEIDSAAHSGFAKEMLRAFEYFKVHGLQLDLVFIADAPEEEREGLARFIHNMADTEHLWAPHSDAGRVYVLNGGDVSDAERTLLRVVARLVFTTRDSHTLEQQLHAYEAANQRYQDKEEYPVLNPCKEFRVWSGLDFYNQYGGFDRDGRDYVLTNTNTPMPWVNVIANPRFGCIVSATMAGFTFAHNAQQFKLTSWSNDIVRDSASEMLLIGRRQFVPATARHGQGWSAFDAEYDNMSVKVRLFVAVERMEKYYQIRVDNKTAAPLTVQLDMVYKLVLGMSEEQTARYLHSEWDAPSNTLRVRNVYHPVYRNQTLLLTATEPLTDLSLDYPNRKRVGLTLTVPAGDGKELAFVMAVAERPDTAFRPLTALGDIREEFGRVEAFWEDRLSHIQVDTPDRSFNYMLNRWYLYQVYSSRLFARAGFYQVGGATGFRDQLQDVMSVLYSDPAYARRQILDHAAHQFAEGDVLHWWHSSMRLGARTTFSDDYLWLVFVTHQYVRVTGDIGILAETVPFCQADRLAPGEAERGMNYAVPEHWDEPLSDTASAHPDIRTFEYATLYEHLRRSVNRAMSRIGIHGLPLMGCGDWNDGMSRVGVEGRGESVWVAFFLADLLPKMEELTQRMPGADLSYCEELSRFRARLVRAIQDNAWDGDRPQGGEGTLKGWFLRAYFDNGELMGSRNNIECQIDLISQAWSILTDVATPDQKESVMRETDSRLVDREHELIRLLTPPFRNSHPSPGYIMNYPEGVRENGGQYTHGAMWYIMAQLKEGRYDQGYFLYSLINPIHRTRTLADVLKYKVEPYCIAADIYSNPQHPGRGGWTWYTGSASWAYKTGVETILGLHKQGDTLVVDPRVPTEWTHFTVRYRHGGSTYVIRYERQTMAMSIPVAIPLVDDGQEHEIVVH